MEDQPKLVAKMAANEELQSLRSGLYPHFVEYKYTYNFSWMGLPIIQFPQDIVAMQEMIWQIRPDLIVETGIAHGGSLVFYASMLELLGGDGLVVGVDVDIRPHNRETIEKHPMSGRIRMIEGSSVDPGVVQQVRDLASGRQRVLVTLDSMHSHEHVIKELNLYSPLVPKGSYLVVFDTAIEELPPGTFTGRPWDKGDNPYTAVQQFLRETDRFVPDTDLDSRLLFTSAPGGYLKCVKD